MSSIGSRYTYGGGISAIRKLSEEELRVETKWLKKNILAKFIDDCTFAVVTKYGPNAMVTVLFSSDTGKGRRGRLIVNAIKGPNGETYAMLPGIDWRWSALHDIWEHVSNPAHDSYWNATKTQANDIIRSIMYKGSGETQSQEEQKEPPLNMYRYQQLPTITTSPLLEPLTISPQQPIHSLTIAQSHRDIYDELRLSVETELAKRGFKFEKIEKVSFLQSIKNFLLRMKTYAIYYRIG